jgi:hypothetical protein
MYREEIVSEGGLWTQRGDDEVMYRMRTFLERILWLAAGLWG